MIAIDYRDTRPIYEQVRDSLRDLIVTGVIAAGEKVPSVRELAAALAINPNTIQRAYRELESEGYLCTVPGKGSFACESDSARLARRQELSWRFRALAKELRALGMTEEDMMELIRGGDDV